MANIYAVETGSTNRLRDRVAAEVRAWRGRLSLSQADLGRILGVSQAQVSLRLRGQIEFTLTEIEALSTAFGITPSDLMPPPPRGTTPGDRPHAPIGAERPSSWESVTDRYPACLPARAA